jgi:hypothetical protein
VVVVPEIPDWDRSWFSSDFKRATELESVENKSFLRGRFVPGFNAVGPGRLST